MALFNDLKKLLFGAKAVTKSAAEKAVDATKETGSDLWDKVQNTVADFGNTAAEKADIAMDKAAGLVETAKDKVNEFVNDTPKPVEAPDDTDEVMDAIIAERKAAAQPAETITNDVTEEILELPPLKAVPDSPKLLDDGNPDNNDDGESAFLDSLKGTAAATGSTTVMDKGGAALDKAGDFASEVGKKMMDTGSRLTERFGETAEHVGEAIIEKGGVAIEKAGEFANKVGGKLLESGGKFTEKFGETAENVGEAIIEKGSEALDRAKDLAAGLSVKILQAKDDLFAKAQAEAEKSGETTSSLIDKAKELNQKLEDKISGNNTKFADTPLTTGGSEFEKHDSFWEKADRFAKGDYQMKGDQLKSGEVKVSENPKTKPSDKHTDDLIDDAIVEG